MSTKTTIKRIALVAVAALGFGMVSNVSANAAATVTGGVWSASSGAVYSGAGTSTGSQTVGNIATFTYSETATASANNTVELAGTLTSSGTGNVTSVTVTTGGGSQTPGSAVNNGASVVIPGTTLVPDGTTAAFPNSATGWGLAIEQDTAAATLYTITVKAFSSAAGVQTLTFTTNSGTVYTATLNWISVTGVGASSTTSTMWAQTSGTCDVTSTTHAGDLSRATLSGVKSSYYSDGIYLCYVIRDVNDNKQALSVAPTIFTGLGGAISTNTDTTGQPSTAVTIGAALSTGATTITGIFKDTYGNTISLSIPFTYFGKAKTISLTNGTYSAYYKGAAIAAASAFASYADGTADSVAGTAEIGNPGSKSGLLILTAKDSNGATVDLNNSTANTALGVTFTVDSTYTTGSPVKDGNDSAGDTVATSYNTADIKYLGGNGILVTCGKVAAEKLTITANGFTSAGVAISSEPVTFYCAGKVAASTGITVTPATTTVEKSAITQVSVKVVDASGYPVPDGTSVTYAATGDGTVAPTESTTSNGVAGTSDSTVINFVGANRDGSATVTAIVGNYAGAATISVGTGTSDASSATDAANEATDAANAATDAANAAAEAADAATAAAQDAQAAVAALATQVSTLIAGIKAQITTLTNLVIKIQKKVKA